MGRFQLLLTLLVWVGTPGIPCDAAIVHRVRRSLGEPCLMWDGVLGRCEEPAECHRTKGVMWRKSTVTFCDSSDVTKTHVCCRHPFHIAKELCESWKDYWYSNNGSCVFVPPPTIHHGSEAMVGEFPEIARLGSLKDITNYTEENIFWNCGASLISPYFAITTAHCVLRFRTRAYVIRFGEYDTNLEEEGHISRVRGPIAKGLHRQEDLYWESRDKVPIKQTLIVKEVILHPEYSDESHIHNIALLRLDSVVLTHRVLPACLPHDAEKDHSQTPLYIAGWGSVDAGGSNFPNVLQVTETSLVPETFCDKTYEELRYIKAPGITEDHLCTGRKGVTACYGDSGMPLVYKEAESIYSDPCVHRIIGIVSFGYGCGKYPDVHTRVSSYVEWITSYVAPTMLPSVNTSTHISMPGCNF